MTGFYKRRASQYDYNVAGVPGANPPERHPHLVRNCSLIVAAALEGTESSVLLAASY